MVSPLGLTIAPKYNTAGVTATATPSSSGARVRSMATLSMARAMNSATTTAPASRIRYSDAEPDVIRLGQPTRAWKNGG